MIRIPPLPGLSWLPTMAPCSTTQCPPVPWPVLSLTCQPRSVLPSKRGTKAGSLAPSTAPTVAHTSMARRTSWKREARLRFRGLLGLRARSLAEPRAPWREGPPSGYGCGIRSRSMNAPKASPARLMLALLVGAYLSATNPRALLAEEPATLAGHPVVLDRGGRLLSWAEPQGAPYPAVVRLAWEQLLTGFAAEENGLPTWLTYCCFDGKTLRGTSWPHNPASFYAGLAQGARPTTRTRATDRVIDLLRRALDHQIAHGTTPKEPSWAWPGVPYASSDPGAVRYRGAHDFRFADPKDPPRLGRGDGYGVIEPDKLGELGVGYLIALRGHGGHALPRGGARLRRRPGSTRAPGRRHPLAVALPGGGRDRRRARGVLREPRAHAAALRRAHASRDRRRATSGGAPDRWRGTGCWPIR